MMSNEIKKDAFPYIVRMKLSELLSNSMHFVKERERWCRPVRTPRGWREYEATLADIIRTAIEEQDRYYRKNTPSSFGAPAGESALIALARQKKNSQKTTRLTETHKYTARVISRPKNIEGAVESFARSRNRDRNLRAVPGLRRRTPTHDRLGPINQSRSASPDKKDRRPDVEGVSTNAVATATDEASAAISALGKRIDSTYGVGKGADASLLEQALEQQHHSRTVAMLKVLA
eukprot:COSAG02_NODE_24036_length_699_cov_2.696667_1_plen_232_part_11